MRSERRTTKTERAEMEEKELAAGDPRGSPAGDVSKRRYYGLAQ
jgi:hypothetical protein